MFAFLAKNVIESEYNSSVLAESWTTAEPLLRRVGLCLKESAREMSSGNPTVLLPLEQIARQKRFVLGLNRDAVAAREPGETHRPHAFRTLWTYPHGEVTECGIIPFSTSC
jgi:hypothetical protein